MSGTGYPRSSSHARGSLPHDYDRERPTSRRHIDLDNLVRPIAGADRKRPALHDQVVRSRLKDEQLCGDALHFSAGVGYWRVVRNDYRDEVVPPGAAAAPGARLGHTHAVADLC